jgi:predicted transcriptional regulator
MNLTPEACRAGRALLSWSMRDLAQKAGLALGTVNRLEGGDTDTRPSSAMRIVQTFAAHGVTLINDPDQTGAILAIAQKVEASGGADCG